MSRLQALPPNSRKVVRVHAPRHRLTVPFHPLESQCGEQGGHQTHAAKYERTVDLASRASMMSGVVAGPLVRSQPTIHSACSRFAFRSSLQRDGQVR